MNNNNLQRGSSLIGLIIAVGIMGFLVLIANQMMERTKIIDTLFRLLNDRNEILLQVPRIIRCSDVAQACTLPAAGGGVDLFRKDGRLLTGPGTPYAWGTWTISGATCQGVGSARLNAAPNVSMKGLPPIGPLKLILHGKCSNGSSGSTAIADGGELKAIATKFDVPGVNFDATGFPDISRNDNNCRQMGPSSYPDPTVEASPGGDPRWAPRQGESVATCTPDRWLVGGGGRYIFNRLTVPDKWIGGVTAVFHPDPDNSNSWLGKICSSISKDTDTRDDSPYSFNMALCNSRSGGGKLR